MHSLKRLHVIDNIHILRKVYKMCTYEVIEGYRKDSSANTNGGYTHRKDKDAKGIRYEMPWSCQSLLKFQCIVIIKEHENHDESESEITFIKVLPKLKRRAEDSQESVRELFDEEDNESEVEAEDAFSLMGNCAEEFKVYQVFPLTEYYRSVTIVINPERGFLNHQITHFHRQVPRFSHLSGGKMSQIFAAVYG